MNVILTTLLSVPQTAAEVESASTGLEWLVVASFLLPFVLLLILLYIGNRITV